jgi:uncharacterized membrane protein YccC
MKDMRPLVRTVSRGAALLLLVGVGALIARPATSQDRNRRVGYANLYAVQTQAKLYGQGFEEIAARAQANEDRKVVENSWRFVSADDARRAVTLELRGAERTSDEDAELSRLREQNSQLELEWYRLRAKTTPTDAELARFAELQRLVDRRQQEIRNTVEGLDKDIATLRDDVWANFNTALASSLHKTAEKHGLEVILSSHVPSWQPNPSGDGKLSVYWENVVLYGGVDVTEDVIATLNDQGPPPAPTGGGVVTPNPGPA